MTYHNVLAIDWSHKKLDLAYLINADNQIETKIEKLSLRDTIEKYAKLGFSTIVLESTFESYNLPEHNAVVNTAKELGIQLLAINPRETGHWRLRTDSEKTDALDAKSILEMYLTGEKHFCAAKLWNNLPSDEAWKQYIKELVKYRSQDWKRLLRHPITPELQTAVKYFKSIEATTPFGYELGEIKIHKRTQKRTTKLSESFVLPIILVAMKCNTKEEFNRRIGMYGNGYPTMLRSNFYYSRVTTLVKRQLNTRSLHALHNTDECRTVRKDVMQHLRRAVFSIYHEVKKLQTL